MHCEIFSKESDLPTVLSEASILHLENKTPNILPCGVQLTVTK